MTHTLTKNGKIVAKVTVYHGGVVAQLFGKCEGMTARFSSVNKARQWAEMELS